MKAKIAIVALATLSLVSCNKDNESLDGSNFPADGVIRVTTSVNGLQSRAGGTTDNLTQFGLCVTNPNSTTYSYNNKLMTKSSGAWSSSDILLWQSSAQSVDIVAYAPYQSAVEYTTSTTDAIMDVSADQSAADESGIIASDFLGVRKSSFMPGTDLVDGKISLALAHLMSKVNITLTLGTEFNVLLGTGTNPVKDLMVNGARLKGVCNLTTMLIIPAVADNDAAAVIPFVAAYTAGEGDTKNAVANYEAILVPQTVAANGFTVSFVINGKMYNWVSTATITLDKSTQYNLNLTVGKDIVTMKDFGSSEWENGTGGNIETE